MSVSQLSRRLLAGAAWLICGAAQAAPAAPTLIYDAAPKQVLFDWNYVPQANYYELWFKADTGAAWAKFGERPSWNPHWDANISSHLLNWFDSRWDVRACNPSGCSAPRSLDIGSTIVNSVGYVKPAQPRAFANFGAAIDVSEDGKTLVAVAPAESTTSAPGSGRATVYVFRNTGGKWRQEARLLPSESQAGNGADATVSVSGDGNLLALGLPAEHFGPGSGATAEHGAVYVFRHDDGSWHEQQRIAYTDAESWHLGAFTKLSDDGHTLAVTQEQRPGDHLTTYRLGPAGWEVIAHLPSAHHEQQDFDMSGDARWLFIRWRDGCDYRIESFDFENHYLRDNMHLTLPEGYELSSFDVDSTGDTIVSGVRPASVAQGAYDSARWKPTVTVYHHDGTAYQTAAVLAPSAHQPTSYAKRSLFGDAVALSGKGTYVAVYDAHDAYGANGVQLPPTAPYDSTARGSIYLFEKRPTGYRERRHIGANGGTPAYVDGVGIFGALAFGNDGKTFAAAKPDERGKFGGIRRSGDPQTSDDSLTNAGAVWLY